MRKIFLSILVCVILTSFVGCGQQNEAIEAEAQVVADAFTDGDSDSYQCCYHIFTACASLCDLSRQQENAQMARTHRKVATGYDNVDTYNLLP